MGMTGKAAYPFLP